MGVQDTVIFKPFKVNVAFPVIGPHLKHLSVRVLAQVSLKIVLEDNDGLGAVRPVVAVVVV